MGSTLGKWSGCLSGNRVGVGDDLDPAESPIQITLPLFGSASSESPCGWRLRIPRLGRLEELEVCPASCSSRSLLLLSIAASKWLFSSILFLSDSESVESRIEGLPSLVALMRHSSRSSSPFIKTVALVEDGLSVANSSIHAFFSPSNVVLISSTECLRGAPSTEPSMSLACTGVSAGASVVLAVVELALPGVSAVWFSASASVVPEPFPFPVLPFPVVSLAVILKTCTSSVPSDLLVIRRTNLVSEPSGISAALLSSVIFAYRSTML